jgi:predicted nucleic acid-binding protein
MSAFTAIYDACVLYPAPLRDLLMHIAMTDLYRARWTAAIHEEWMRSVLAKRVDLNREQLSRTRELMDQSVLDALVTGYEPLIEGLSLPDPEDRHVLAAAIASGAAVIVTFNLKDFPASALEPHGIEALHPDDFLTAQLELDRVTICRAFRNQRETLRSPAKTIDQMFDTFMGIGLAEFVGDLRQYRDWL